eukprot:7384458-Prymnesium_polylepis.2
MAFVRVFHIMARSTSRSTRVTLVAFAILLQLAASLEVSFVREATEPQHDDAVSDDLVAAVQFCLRHGQWRSRNDTCGTVGDRALRGAWDGVHCHQLHDAHHGSFAGAFAAQAEHRR